MNNLKAKLMGGSDTAKSVQRAWRVNFVNQASLPDIKVIRTEFLVNYGCIALALVACGFALSQEISLRDSNAELDKTNAAIQALVPTDGKVREKSALCGEYLAVLDGYSAYKKSELDLFSLYAAVGALKADDVVYNNLLVDLAAPGPAGKSSKCKLIISGHKKGISGKSFERIAALYADFMVLPYFKTLKGYKVTPEKAPITAPDAQNQVVNFTFELTLEPK